MRTVLQVTVEPYDSGPKRWSTFRRLTRPFCPGPWPQLMQSWETTTAPFTGSNRRMSIARWSALMVACTFFHPNRRMIPCAPTRDTKTFCAALDCRLSPTGLMMPADVACTFSQQLHPLVGVDTNRAPLLFLYVDDYSGSIV